MIYPISFCFPTSRILPMRTTKTKEISDIVPGEPYSFDDQDAYLEEYAQSHYAYTQKKAGFDCMRHLEILAAGSVPLFEEPWTIPKFTMTHYNKELFEKGKEANPFEWRDHFMKHLTAPAMVKYICDSIGVSDPKRVLFMDNAVPLMPDYLSMGLFYGCKELFGENMDVLEEIPYAYDDYDKDVAQLYGRGFNYTKLLPASAKSKTTPSEISASLWANEYDLVLFPSIMRGTSLHNLQEVLRTGFPREKIALCIGEDKPFSHWKQFPVVTQMVSDFNLFVRELD